MTKQRKTIGKEELISTMKRMAVDKGLRESEIDRFLDKYAFDSGALRLLENLNAIGFRLGPAANTIEYLSSRTCALDGLERILKGGEMILSVGCGEGLLEVNLAILGYHVQGVDIDANSLRVARRLAEDSGVAGRCRFRRVKGEHLPFKRGIFDIVLYSHSWHHVGNRSKSLRESRRVLKPTGYVAVIEDREDIPGLTKTARGASLVVKKRNVLFPGKTRDDGLVKAVMFVVLRKGRTSRHA